MLPSQPVHRPSRGLEEIRGLVAARDANRLLKAIATFEQGEFLEVWALLDELSPAPGMLTELRMRSLFRAGLWEDPDELLKVVCSTAGQGIERCCLIRAVFHGSHASLDRLIGIARRTADAAERKTAFEGLAQNIASRQSLDELSSLASWDDLPHEAMDAIGDGLAGYVVAGSYFGHDGGVQPKLREAFAVARHLAEAGRISAELLREIVIKTIAEAPKEAWLAVSEQFPDLTRDPAVAAATARHLRKGDPIAALDFANQNRLVPTDVVADAMVGAARLDLTRALEWFAQARDSLPPNYRDAAAQGLAVQQAANSKFLSAWDWVRQIEDSEAKRKAEGRVWQQQLDAVRAEAKKDPQAALGAILSGHSQHADYWLEEAMGQWIARDSEAAAAWYERTGSSLPPEKRQYVAAAYARESLRQGDSELARRWAAMITDDKTRQRIEGEIAQAGVPAGP